MRGKHQIVAGLDGKRLDGVKGNLLLSWVTPLQLAWAIFDVDQMVDYSIHGVAPDVPRARAIHRNAEPFSLLAPAYLSTKIDVNVAAEISNVVRLQTEQTGKEVIGGGVGDFTSVIAEAILWGCASASYRMEKGDLVQVRSAFGVHRVEDSLSRVEGQLYPSHRLVHGYTLHGQQLMVPALLDLPVSYYHASGPVGQVFRAYNTDPKRPFAVLDLGVGTMAAYGLPGQTVDFYELDPELAKLSFDTDQYFTYVADAHRRGVNVNLVLGDARSTFTGKGTHQRLKPLLAREGNPRPKRRFGSPVNDNFKYRLILVDTLSPDAIPGHLRTRVTKEAVKGYLGRLDDDGVVLIHISSRYFNLQPALANLAEELGVAGFHLSDDDATPAGKNRSHWVALTRKRENMSKVLSVPRWTTDADQLSLLAGAAWPVGGSSAALTLGGLCHACQALADLQARAADEQEGLPGDRRMVASGWRALETTAELRRLIAEAPKRIRDLTVRIDALTKNLPQARRDPELKVWLEARVASLGDARKALQSNLGAAPEKLRRNAEVGLWTDASCDLVSVFVE